MGGLSCSTWLRHAGILFACSIPTLAAIYCWPIPTKAALKSVVIQRNETMNTVATLKQSERRWIEVDLSKQRLIAWTGRKPSYAVIVSTGKLSTTTPTGVFVIQSRHRLARMQGSDYNIPDVPYTMYYSGNYAIHGTYWHHRFGTPVSHGCINVAVDHARWLFNWTSVGTPVVVHD